VEVNLEREEARVSGDADVASLVAAVQAQGYRAK
jgi:hypothetical protein